MKSDLDPPPSSSASGSEKTSRWTQQDDLVLIEGLSQQKSLGQNHDSIWSADAWTAVADLLKGSEHISGGAQKTVQQCKARWQRVSAFQNGPLFADLVIDLFSYKAENRV